MQIWKYLLLVAFRFNEKHSSVYLLLYNIESKKWNLLLLYFVKIKIKFNLVYYQLHSLENTFKFSQMNFLIFLLYVSWKIRERIAKFWTSKRKV